jgi:outer membrane protein OmpA-like peptidoglycan-associated protein
MSIGKAPQLKLFKGTVSEVSGLPLDATVMITETETNQVVAKIKSHPETGTFVTMLQAFKNYTILVEKEGFLFYSDLVNLADIEMVDLSRDIKMQKLLPGVTLVLNNIFFDFGKSSLKKESSQELQRILFIMRQNAGLKAEISSHLDDSGIEEFSQKLSENRAQAVMDYLVATGIKSTRLIAKGYGSTKPISNNETEQGRAANRRTEFKILSVQ